MRTTIGIKGVARSVLVALALMIAAGACGKLSGPAPDQDGGQPKKSKFKITGVVSLITDWVVPSVHAAEAIAWKEPTASVAKSQTEPGPCPNEFEPVNDGLYAYLYRIAEDTLDIEALDPATLKPLCVTRVDEKSGTYTFDFTDEDPELNAAYIVAKRFAAAEGGVSGSASNLTLKSPFYLFSGLPTGDTNYLAPVARPPGEQLMVAKKMLVVGSEAPQALVEAAPEAPNSALSAKDFLREAFFSKTTDVIAGESDLKLDIDPVSSVGLGTKAVAYRMGGISKALANGLNTTPAELLTSLLNDTSVAEAVTTAIGNGEFTLADLVSGDPKAIIGKISEAPSLKPAIASFRQNALSDPVSTAVKIVKARGAENTEKLLLQYATDLEGSVARAGFEAPGRVALAVEVLNKVHALAMKNDFPNVAMKTEATLVVAADQITARLKKYEDEAIAKLKEEEENIVQGEGFELVEAKPMDPAKIFAAMGTTRQAAFRRFNTVFQNNLNPEFLNFQSNESAESLLIASKTISPMFETATLFINEQEAAALLAIEELGLMATKAYGSENIEELDALFQKLRSLPVLLFSLKTKTIAAQALWNLESMLKKLRETLAARALEPAAETPEEPSNIAGETPPLSDIDQQFLSTMSPLFEKLHVAAEGGDLKAADYYYGELKQLYVDFSSQGLSDGAIVTFKTQMEEAYQLLETARMAPAA